jgi:hypothetical protein
MINPNRVTEIFKQSLSESGTIVEGITANFGLDVVGKEDEIGDMLDELPAEFQASGGGGWTFLNACNDKDGNQWTGMHAVMEQLFCLGIAAGKARWTIPRDMWATLPGGMPYVSIN